ncbi:type II toxin-antitoxin system HicA family toxin [Bacillus cytotoxicus]|nr:type II toxin-antitoxin system HicA family toxin [Bacillus cytotoxicus]AWC41377.1 type II toxin-antitoxin system HicA family toxin [Bacillus cytotoxicus]AWC45246.1 type II toxin-antitoxin system HicA family toxin [Bacillus cytotoxicus]AWC49308.1 type II toxin-antitoxin system HicA family toxin [Bacillus cytotoxicus]AWC53323.1 type II toxin-antitoxin system HicA family toxin [Bacillus cytotoxicus]
MSSREVIKRLKKEGCFLVNIEDNHHQFKHPSKVGKVTVKHSKMYISLNL